MTFLFNQFIKFLFTKNITKYNITILEIKINSYCSLKFKILQINLNQRLMNLFYKMEGV